MTANTVECKKLITLVARNTRCYFKDKFTFFMSLITPIILLVLFVTFLRNVYIDSFNQVAIDLNKEYGTNIVLSEKILNGITGAWLMSSILSVSSVTVAFCSNIIMIADKMDGNLNDFSVSPVKRTTISVSYFVSNFFVTFLVMIAVMLIGHIYLAVMGWYIPARDAFMIIVDVICNILFGTLLAGVVESFISTQGGLSAVSTLVSSMYGFICGAYMPFSQFSEGLRNVLCLLPGSYGVGILRNHYMNGYITEICNGIDNPAVAAGMRDGISNGFDIKIAPFGAEIPLGAMYGILLGTSAVLLVAYILIIILKNKKKKGV